MSRFWKTVFLLIIYVLILRPAKSVKSGNIFGMDAISGKYMNILILIRRFDFGGAENHVRELANALSDKGHKVFVLSKKGRQQRLLSCNVKFRFVSLSKWLLPINLIYLFIIAKKHRIEIIHAHQPSAILHGSLLGRLIKIPVIVTVHSVTSEDLFYGFTRRTPARVIYISRYTMERSGWYSSLRPKCRYIPNGIMPDRYFRTGESNRLLYCSRLDKYHAGLLLILIEDVMPQLKRKFPDIVLEIIGDGCMFKKIESWAEKTNKLSGSDTVVLTGFKERFITDGFLVIGAGRVALEALSSGVPVLSVNRNRGGSRISTLNYEIIKQTNFVDVTAQKPAAGLIIESISEIYRNYREAVDDSQYLRKKVNTEFSLSNMVEKIQQEYLEAIDEMNI